MPKAIVYKEPGHVEVEEVAKQECGKGDVLVKTKYASICGGELHMYRSGYGAVPGRINGHEYMGYAEEVGEEVEGIKPGDRVWGMTANICGECWACQHEDYWHCSNVLNNVTGHGVPGGFGQYVLLSPAVLGQTIFKIPDEISDRHAALIEPFSVGCAEVNTAEVKEGDKVVVIGAGMIGNSIIQFAKLAGAAEVIAVDIADNRLNIALECGADYVINSAKEDVLTKVMEIWGENAWFYGPSGTADVVFETAGVGNTVNDAVACVRAGGKLVLVAPSEKDVSLNLAPVINKAPQIIIPISGAYTQPTIDAMAAGKLVVEPLLGDIFPIDKATEAFETQMDPNKSMKVLIELDPEN